MQLEIEKELYLSIADGFYQELRIYLPVDGKDMNAINIFIHVFLLFNV